MSSRTLPRQDFTSGHSRGGASVYIDAAFVGVSDGLFELSPGPHRVRLELPGHEPIERQVEPPPAQILRLEVTLRVEPAAGPRVDSPATAPSALPPTPTTAPSGPDILADADTAAGAAVKFLQGRAQSDLAQAAALKAARRRPAASAWSGQEGEQ